MTVWLSSSAAMRLLGVSNQGLYSVVGVGSLHPIRVQPPRGRYRLVFTLDDVLAYRASRRPCTSAPYERNGIREEEVMVSVEEAGARGGNRTFADRGPEWFSTIGKLGGARLRELQGPAFYQDIGKQGGASLLARRGPEWFSHIGKLGGQARHRPIPLTREEHDRVALLIRSYCKTMRVSMSSQCRAAGVNYNSFFVGLQSHHGNASFLAVAEECGIPYQLTDE